MHPRPFRLVHRVPIDPTRCGFHLVQALAIGALLAEIQSGCKRNFALARERHEGETQPPPPPGTAGIGEAGPSSPVHG